MPEQMDFILINLYTNDAFRKLFNYDPQSIIEIIGAVSEEEEKALKLININQLNIFANSLKAKVKNMIEDYFQILFDFDYERISRLFLRFYFMHRLFPEEPNIYYLERFGRYMTQQFEIEEDNIFYNTAKFLTQKIQATFNQLPEYEITPEYTDDSVPTLAPFIKIAAYEFDMQKLLTSPRETPLFKKTYYLMYTNDGFKVTVLEISKAIYFLLNLSNGRSKLSEIYQKISDMLELDMSNQMVSQSLSPFLTDLVRTGKIYFSRRQND